MKRDMACVICETRTLHEWSRKYRNLCWCTVCHVMKVMRAPAVGSEAVETAVDNDPLHSL